MPDILDDVWESDGGEELKEPSSFDIKKLRDSHIKRGYLDGVTKSKDTNLQKGFNEGFPTGAEIGLKIGKLIGILQALNLKYGEEDDELRENLKLAQHELLIQKVLTKSMFDPDLNLQGEHVIVKKWISIVEMHCKNYSIDTRL
ncbi:hypothetical protein HG535_0G05380 [Zygotorulaspora mrakii]|uniref:Protein YAE1 n=1 Tax=Zygotorulaspora mrakii TaxID=42260 RepID=A0A7H9B7K9_ZYGMR|nr:uncharacterized protein HG535_0G05380 [Zygotorulaspora mrakii]QLG74655.1 hypothetical protein HG535_0G05380 [Zygotorulaspora mrakii]